MEDQNKPPKIYFGNLREKERPSSGDKFLVGSFCKEDIDSIPKECLYKGKHGKHYFDVIISPYKEGVNERGHTHSASLDKKLIIAKKSDGNVNDNDTETEINGNN